MWRCRSGQAFHPIARQTNNPNDKIEGMAFEISDEELAMSDAYEVSDYKRISAICASGKQVWVYVAQVADVG